MSLMDLFTSFLSLFHLFFLLLYHFPYWVSQLVLCTFTHMYLLLDCNDSSGENEYHPVMFWSIVCTHLSLPVTMTTVDLALVWVDSDRIIHLYSHRLLTLLSNSCNINDFVFVCSGGRGGPGMVAVGRHRIEASAFAVIFSKKAGRFSSR